MNRFFLTKLSPASAALTVPDIVLSEWGVKSKDKLLLWVEEDYSIVLANPNAEHFLAFTPDTVKVSVHNRIRLPEYITALYALDKQKLCFMYYHAALGMCRIRINCQLSNDNVVPFSFASARISVAS